MEDMAFYLRAFFRVLTSWVHGGVFEEFLESGPRVFVAAQLGERRAESLRCRHSYPGSRYSLNSSRAVKAVSGKSEKTPSTPSP